MREPESELCTRLPARGPGVYVYCFARDTVADRIAGAEEFRADRLPDDTNRRSGPHIGRREHAPAPDLAVINREVLF